MIDPDTTGCMAFSVQECCDRLLITLSRTNIQTTFFYNFMRAGFQDISIAVFRDRHSENGSAGYGPALVAAYSLPKTCRMVSCGALGHA